MSKITRIGPRVLVAPDIGDLEDAAYEGVWYPQCPYCGALIPAEPDADAVVCQVCERQVSLVSIV